MALSSMEKCYGNNCNCEQKTSAFCQGCSHQFCTQHFLDHRHLLSEEIKKLIYEHEQIQNDFKSNFDVNLLIKQIDQWENESIKKIQDKAQNLRKELIELTTCDSNDTSMISQDLTKTLKENEKTHNFIETDLHRWKNMLDDLRQKLKSPKNLVLSRYENQSFIQDISITCVPSNELFDHVFDETIQILDNGQLAVHNKSYKYTEIRGKNQYIIGCHEIRLSIEKSSDIWMFLGISSKSIPLHNNSSQLKSAYGWTNDNSVWIDGQYQIYTSNPAIEMQSNDIICLTIDCDNHLISIINQRTQGKNELLINTNFCPFPWQLSVILFEANSSIRILSN